MRSSGPGGQNVNKLNSKVDLRFKVAEAEWLPQQIRDHIINNVSYFIMIKRYLIKRYIYMQLQLAV